MDFNDAVAGLAQRGPGRMIPDLRRITTLADLLGDPQLTYPSIHVTGTNGKTSVVRMAATLISAIGLTAGTYTSPHLQSVRERFTFAGRWIGQAEFAAAYDQVVRLAEHAEKLDPEAGDVTYFELLTGMAYWWFADKPVDVGIFEVGMGGTWDATNLVRGDVAVITRIGLDHRELGSTPAEIAVEKSGIIKEGSVVVLGPQEPEVLDVIRSRAADVGATVREWGRDHDVVERRVAVGGQALSLRVGDRVVDDIFLPLHGRHQADNAAVALAALVGFLGGAAERVSDDLVRAGLDVATSPGRLEVVGQKPTVLLDGAHNPQGARTVAAAVEEAFDFRNLTLVIGCLADKDFRGVVEAFKELASHVVVVTPPSPRALAVDELATLAREVWAGSGVIVEEATDVAHALELATGIAAEGDGVLVSGSLYTVGAARDVYVPVEGDGDEIVDDVTLEEDEEDEFQRAIDEMIDRVDAERNLPSDDEQD